MPSQHPIRTGPSRDFIRSGAIETVPRPESVSPNAGRTSGGTAITITGRNFANAPDGTVPTVLVGGVAATDVVVVDAQTITCNTGATDDAVLANLEVTIGSQTGTLYGCFTYFESTITQVTPSFGPLSGGTDVIIEGYNFLPGSIVLFDDEEATDVVFLDEQHIACKTPAHAVGFVDVEVIEPEV